MLRALQRFVRFEIMAGQLVFSRENPEQYASAHKLYLKSLPDITHFARFGTLAYPDVDKQESLAKCSC